MKSSTVSRRMWSASTRKGRVQSSSLTAASAAGRTLAGREPTMECSRCDLFHTGVTSTPCAAAIAHARSCAFAWCAKRSPTPNEYFSNLKASLMFSPLFESRRIAILIQPACGFSPAADSRPCERSSRSRSCLRTSPHNLVQELRESELLFPDTFDGQSRHHVRAERREVRVVFDAVRVVRVLARLQLKEKLPRSVRPVLFENLLALAVHVNERDVLGGGDGADDAGVLAVRVLKVPLPVEASAHDGSQEYGDAAFGAHVGDEAREVPAVLVG